MCRGWVCGTEIRHTFFLSCRSPQLELRRRESREERTEVMESVVLIVLSCNNKMGLFEQRRLQNCLGFEHWQHARAQHGGVGRVYTNLSVGWVHGGMIAH